MPQQPFDPPNDRLERPRLLRLGAVIALLAVVVGACTEPTPELPETAEPPEASEPEQPPAEQEPDDPPPAAPDAEDEVGRLWEAFHAAWVEQAALDDPDPAAFDGLAADPDATVEQLDALRAGGRLVTTDQELWPSFDIDGDRAEIVDCAIVTQHPADQPDSAATITVSWAAAATLTDDGWRIENARPGDLFCIAEELNSTLIDAYSAWLSGHGQWYEPADPEHPLLAATMADPGLSDMRAILADDRDAGISMRFPHETEAAVTEVGHGTARVIDCYVAPDDYGAFDAESGERRPDVVPAPEPDQLNRTVADLERTADGWRVVGWRWEEQNDCEPGETRYEVL